MPGAATVLEEDMVVALEPGSCAGIGVRLEQVVVVMSEGCEVVSGHDRAL